MRAHARHLGNCPFLLAEPLHKEKMDLHTHDFIVYLDFTNSAIVPFPKISFVRSLTDTIRSHNLQTFMRLSEQFFSTKHMNVTSGQILTRGLETPCFAGAIFEQLQRSISRYFFEEVNRH